MKIVIIFLISFALFCGRGPAKDRAEKNCERNRLMLYLVIADPNFSEGFKRITFLQAALECKEERRDNTIDRYYRGYVLDKE